MPELTQQGLKQRVAEILNRWPAVGLAVGVVRRGSPTLLYSHGVANVEDRTPVTEDTVFRIGSITKTFTAVAVMPWRCPSCPVVITVTVEVKRRIAARNLSPRSGVMAGL